MDKLDLKILNHMQRGLDIVPHPFKKIAESIKIDDRELILRLERIKEKGYIRRIGAVFDATKMGYESILVAMEVPAGRIKEVAEVINSFDEVTHNYCRDNRLNIWFTLTTKDREERNQILDRIKCKSGINKIYEFPSLKKFKTNVFFDMEKL